jgi:hypothetical protein
MYFIIRKFDRNNTWKYLKDTHAIRINISDGAAPAKNLDEFNMIKEGMEK